jgi:hypothetical protein
MSKSQTPRGDEVDQLLRNAELRDELEPYIDESITQINVRRLPTPVENEYLSSMLDWERAPVLPIARWFDPEIELPPLETFSDAKLKLFLRETIQKLFDQHIVLDFTDHLSDRALYRLLARDILPSQEKKLDRRNCYLHWDCADVCGDPQIWLRYYATKEECEEWAESTGQPLPRREKLPFCRKLPRLPADAH